MGRRGSETGNFYTNQTLEPLGFSRSQLRTLLKPLEPFKTIWYRGVLRGHSIGTSSCREWPASLTASENNSNQPEDSCVNVPLLEASTAKLWRLHTTIKELFYYIFYSISVYIYTFYSIDKQLYSTLWNYSNVPLLEASIRRMLLRLHTTIKDLFYYIFYSIYVNIYTFYSICIHLFSTLFIHTYILLNKTILIFRCSKQARRMLLRLHTTIKELFYKFILLILMDKQVSCIHWVYRLYRFILYYVCTTLLCANII